MDANAVTQSYITWQGCLTLTVKEMLPFEKSVSIYQ